MEKRRKSLSILSLASALMAAAAIVILTDKLTQRQDPISLHLHTPDPRPELPCCLKNAKRIVCTGDSITSGDNCSLNFVTQLRQYLNALYPGRFEVINLGKNSDTSTTLKARFAADVMSQNPDQLIVLVGVNDLSPVAVDRSKEKEVVMRYHQNMGEIADIAKKSKCSLLFLSGFLATEQPDSEANRLLGLLSAELEAIAAEKGASVIRIDVPALAIIRKYRETGATDLFLTIDGVHPNLQGHQIITNCILTALQIDSNTRRLAQ